MKAKIVQQKICEGVIVWEHGGGGSIKRLVVEEAENLVITPDRGQVFVWTNFDLHADKSCKVLGEVEIPNKLVKKALALARAQKELNDLEDTFNQLLGQMT